MTSVTQIALVENIYDLAKMHNFKPLLYTSQPPTSQKHIRYIATLLEWAHNCWVSSIEYISCNLPMGHIHFSCSAQIGSFSLLKAISRLTG